METSSRFALLPDTEQSRLLAELSSFHEDLSEAGDAIDQALEAGADSSLWQPLTSYAVVAYMRAFAHSNVRSGLLEHIVLPDNVRDTHNLIRRYRNTTIAHSQSELTMSLPVVALTPDGRVDKVLPVTIRHALPLTTAQRIAHAIERIAALVGDQLRLLSAQMAQDHEGTTSEVIASWPAPTLVHERAEEFTAASSRRPHSPRFVAYWDAAIDADG